MDWKKALLTSPEFWTGAGLIVTGLIVRSLGVHDLFASALAPFGIGLVLSDIAVKIAKEARERAKIRVRKDDDRNRR